MGLELVGRGADSPEQKVAVRTQGHRAVGEADEALARLLESLQEFAAGLDLLVVAQPAEGRVELVEGEVDELPLDGRGRTLGRGLGRPRRGLRPAGRRGGWRCGRFLCG